MPDKEDWRGRGVFVIFWATMINFASVLICSWWAHGDPNDRIVVEAIDMRHYRSSVFEIIEEMAEPGYSSMGNTI